MKKNQLPFAILFALYAGAGAAAIVGFHVNGSYLSRQQNITAEASQDSDEPEIVETKEPVESEEPAETEESVEIEEPAETEEPVESEEPATADSEETTEAEKTYYGFTVIDGVTGVLIRKSADPDSAMISYIDGGRSGYVLESGDPRTKILTKKGTIGYIHNDYITTYEISKNEFPKEYR